MHTIPVTDSEAATSAALALQHGDVVLYPTDTLYGLGVDALSDDAVAKIYAIKGRDEHKPIHAIVADFTMRFASRLA
jgi:L-threonylcarbamoyladenylate synthase